MRGWLGEEQQCLAIIQGGFGLVCLPPRDLHRVHIVVLCEKLHWFIDLGETFIKDLVHVSDFFDDSR